MNGYWIDQNDCKKYFKNISGDKNKIITLFNKNIKELVILNSSCNYLNIKHCTIDKFVINRHFNYFGEISKIDINNSWIKEIEMHNFCCDMFYWKNILYDILQKPIIQTPLIIKCRTIFLFNTNFVNFITDTSIQSLQIWGKEFTCYLNKSDLFNLSYLSIDGNANIILESPITAECYLNSVTNWNEHSFYNGVYYYNHGNYIPALIKPRILQFNLNKFKDFSKYFGNTVLFFRN